jgi:hypothetical protein
MTTRQILPARRESITHKVRVGNRRTLYLSTHAARPPLEIFIRIRGHASIHFCSSLPDAIGQHLLSLCPDPSIPTQKE